MQMDFKEKINTKKEEPVEITDIYTFFLYLRNVLKSINDSKIFAGLMIIILNVASRFVNLKLSKTIESYFKNTFSRQILVFAIAWMGTRDLFVALFITILFTIFFNYLCNENSMFCILPESFTDYHVALIDNEIECKSFTKEDVDTAFNVLEKARKITSQVSTDPDQKGTDRKGTDRKETTDGKMYLKQTSV